VRTGWEWSALGGALGPSPAGRRAQLRRPAWETRPIRKRIGGTLIHCFAPPHISCGHDAVARAGVTDRGLFPVPIRPPLGRWTADPGGPGAGWRRTPGGGRGCYTPGGIAGGRPAARVSPFPGRASALPSSPAARSVPPSGRPLTRVGGWARPGGQGRYAAGTPLARAAWCWGLPPPATRARGGVAASACPGPASRRQSTRMLHGGPRVLPCQVGVARPSPAGSPTGDRWASPGRARGTLTGCGYPAFADPIPGRLTAGPPEGGDGLP